MKTDKLLLIMLITGSTNMLSQSITSRQADKEYCARDRRLSYMAPTDSARYKAVLDLVNNLLIGQWQLIDIGTKTYTVMPTPEDSIKMSVDKQGNSIVYGQGKQLVNFQLGAGINFNNLRCVISEAGRAYFHLRTNRMSKGQEELSQGPILYPNGLRVCEDYLELYAFTSAGPYYVFKRLPTPIPLENKSKH